MCQSVSSLFRVYILLGNGLNHHPLKGRVAFYFFSKNCNFSVSQTLHQVPARAQEDYFKSFQIFWVKVNKDLAVNTLALLGKTFLQKFLTKGIGRGRQGMEGPKEGKAKTALGRIHHIHVSRLQHLNWLWFMMYMSTHTHTHTQSHMCESTTHTHLNTFYLQTNIY